ncbi:MAG: response regulator transcription factor [Rhodoferax sp.]|uniref:response regulator transcription factor n=1 Tax=Rhodoferax sp. TaxID=50421 RepID=UPI0026245942|nr:response regulator transcription factor [Rhodoferax sp.]MDD5332743.1 response regulator transcription factor [Rhodoferax sp.]
MHELNLDVGNDSAAKFEQDHCKNHLNAFDSLISVICCQMLSRRMQATKLDLIEFHGRHMISRHLFPSPPSLPLTPSLIAVVEDDPGLCADLVEFLQLRGFEAQGFRSAEAFYRAWPKKRFDLLLLDVSLPGDSGLEVAHRVRETDTTGIVMLTALDTDNDQVAGLGAGADAYLSKRSSLEVIEAACRSVLRRLGMAKVAHMAGIGTPTPQPKTRWCLSSQQWKLEAPNGHTIDLTHAELIFLGALFGKPSEAVEREQLLGLLGKPDSLSNLRNLDNAASRLRRKVQQACGMELPVRPSYGKGYTFGAACEVSA